MRHAFFILFCTVSFLNSSQAQVGSLDPSFGNNGVQTTAVMPNLNLFNEGGRFVLNTTAGDIFVVITVFGSYTRIGKYLPDGRLDSTYGQAGFSSGANMTANSAVLQEDKIIAAGYAGNGSNNDFALARYTKDGVLDSSFGNNGIVTTNFDPFSYDFANSIILQGDKIIVAGSSSNNGFALARYTRDGVLDSSFGVNGKVTTDFGNSDYATSVVLQQDNIIVTGAIIEANFNSDFALLRYTRDGVLDSTFGKNGIVKSNFPSGHTVFTSTVVQGNKIIAGGYASDSTRRNDFALVRYTFNGVLDSSFGTNGIVTTDFLKTDNAVNSIALQGDKIIVAGSFGVGSFEGDFVLLRYTSDGVLDSSFGRNGIVTTNLTKVLIFEDYEESSQDVAGTILVQGDKIFVAGITLHPQSDPYPEFYDLAVARYSKDGVLEKISIGDFRNAYDDSQFDFDQSIVMQGDKIIQAGSIGQEIALVRLTTDLALDTSFGVNGIVTTDFTASSEIAQSILLQGDKVIVAGFTALDLYGFPNSGILARYTADGVLDSSFGVNGKVLSDIIVKSFGLEGDKIIVAGYSGNNGFALARYTRDGVLDSTFGVNGKVATNLGGTSFIRNIALQESRLYAVGSLSNVEGTLGVIAAYQLEESSALPSIASFTLVNTTTGQDIQPLNEGDVLDLSLLPGATLNIRANTSPETVGSVLLELSGAKSYQRTVNEPPYLLFGEQGSSTPIGNLTPGNYTLTATPFTEANGLGTPGTPLTIHFQVVDPTTTVWYRDFDRDGFGDPNASVMAGTQPEGYVSNNLDCNDYRVFYQDMDQDGWGSSVKVPCGLITRSGDCDDNNNQVHSPQTFYRDQDGDSWGDVAVTIVECTSVPPTGYVKNRMDCNDGDKAIRYCPPLPVTQITKGKEALAVKGESTPTLQLWAYPNPVKARTRIQYSLPMEAHVRIQVFDVMGREVGLVFSGSRKAGTHYADYQTNRLAQGVYYLRLVAIIRTGKQVVQTQKLVKSEH